MIGRYCTTPGYSSLPVRPTWYFMIKFGRALNMISSWYLGTRETGPKANSSTENVDIPLSETVGIQLYTT